MASEHTPPTEEKIRAATVGDLTPHAATTCLAEPPRLFDQHEATTAQLRAKLEQLEAAS